TDNKTKNVLRIENVGDGWLRGIELEQRIDFRGSGKSYSGLSLWANESFLDSEVQVKNGPKRPFNEQPDFIANFGFGYDHISTGVSLDVSAQFRGNIEKFKADKNEQEKEKEQWTLDLGIRKTLGQNMSLFFDALNLTDAKKKKTKLLGNGEREDEIESTGTLYIVGIKGRF
ncbi:MAG: TonB-dependent receptor domain-containing protein, partial [Nitrospiria bacterium]